MWWRKVKESNPRDVGARHGFQNRFAAAALPSQRGAAWSRMQDSNPRRLVTKQVLLPVELIRQW